MPDPKPTQQQLDYNRIEELKADGMSNADAIRAVASERGASVNAIRANQHAYRQKLGGGGSRRASTGTARARKPAPVTVDGAIAEAKALLEQALATFDREVDAAKTEADAAKTRYDELVASVKERKTELEKKIKALG